MRNLIAFFIRYHVFFVFFLLEIIAVGMLLQSHYYQASRFASSSTAWSGQLLEGFNNSTEYFSLKEINELLAEENARLKTMGAIAKRDSVDFEINQYLGNETVELIRAFGFKHVELRKDMSGNDRMIKAFGF